MCGCGGSGVDGMGEKEKEKADTLHSSKRSCLYFPVFFFFSFYFCVKNHAGLKMRKTHKKYWVPFTKGEYL